jgi:hypothetical protein
MPCAYRRPDGSRVIGSEDLMRGTDATRTAVELLRRAAAIAREGRDPLPRLAAWLRTVPLPEEVEAARPEAIRRARGLPIAALEGGPVLGLRWFPPGVPTDVHDHGGGWGVARVLEGRDRYETWARSADGSLRRVSVRELGPGDVVTFDATTLHVQEGLDAGALELVLLERLPARYAGEVEVLR